jgi:hypothetical protein
MRRRGRTWQSVVSAFAGLALALSATPSAAHVEERSGPFRVTMGWGEEPAYSGSQNFVEVAISDAAGPVVVRPGALDVEVSFGQGQAVTTLPLVPAGAPGQLRATIVPTRPGTYGFHVTGTLRNRTLDSRATCSGATFDCVTDASAVEFPVKDPSNGQIAERIARSLPRAARAIDRADSGHAIAVAALIVAGLALATAAAAVVVRARGK